MNIEQQNRIIELAFQWQQKNEWTAASKAAENFRHHRVQASKDRVVIRRMQEGKTPTGQLDLFQHSATRNEELSEMYHAQVIDAHKDFCELVNLLRTNAPALLEYVPTVDFFSENSSADYSPHIRDLKKLEGAVRACLKPWVPTDAQIQRVKDAIAGMRFKTTNLEAIRVAAKMKKQSVSIILKLIDHKTE